MFVYARYSIILLHVYVFFHHPILHLQHRAGLDPTTLRLLAAYESVIYISCSPDSLARDLQQVSDRTDCLKKHFLG